MPKQTYESQNIIVLCTWFIIVLPCHCNCPTTKHHFDSSTPQSDHPPWRLIEIERQHQQRGVWLGRRPYQQRQSRRWDCSSLIRFRWWSVKCPPSSRCCPGVSLQCPSSRCLPLSLSQSPHRLLSDILTRCISLQIIIKWCITDVIASLVHALQIYLLYREYRAVKAGDWKDTF